MRKSEYLLWMAENTETIWCNDSALESDIRDALLYGATGCTSNPPLTYEALTTEPWLYKEAVDAIPGEIKGDDRVVELIGIVVRYIAGLLRETYDRTAGECGYIRTQVRPEIGRDADAMLKMGMVFASWGRNVKVKIPGTNAGMWVLEELAAMGVPTNPTVNTTVSQMTAAAEAYERGVERARAKGIKPAPSTSAIVIGRLQDYLSALNDERKAELTRHDLECASLAVAKRTWRIFNEKGYRQIIMPAAFRCAWHVEQLAGSRTMMTIHPKIQEEIIKAEAEGNIRRGSFIDEPVDKAVLDKVMKALPEYELAYEPDALAGEDFDRYGATVMTLEAFDRTGWQRLKTL